VSVRAGSSRWAGVKRQGGSAARFWRSPCQRRCLDPPHTAPCPLSPPQPLSCDVVVARGVLPRCAWRPRSLHTAEATGRHTAACDSRARRAGGRLSQKRSFRTAGRHPGPPPWSLGCWERRYCPEPGSAGRPTVPLGSETGPLSLRGQVGDHLSLWWFACRDDLDVRQPEPVGVIVADDGQAVGGQDSSQVGRDDGADAAWGGPGRGGGRWVGRRRGPAAHPGSARGRSRRSRPKGPSSAARTGW
jgi:hypothetical protein